MTSEEGERRRLPDGTEDLLGLPRISMSILPSGLICHYCSAAASSRDHVVPKTKMGVDTWFNLVPSCKTCNGRKGPAMPTCACAFCRRAVRLFEAGWKRNRPRTTAQPVDGLVVGYGPPREIPMSFHGSA